MVVIPRKVDEWIAIGQDLQVCPTDIDAAGVYLVARGRFLGGPRDGERFETRHELAVGGSLSFGANVVVTLVEVIGGEARLGVLAPAHVRVDRKEAADAAKRNGPGEGNHGR